MFRKLKHKTTSQCSLNGRRDKLQLHTADNTIALLGQSRATTLHLHHSRILSPDKTEWWLISATLCR